MHVMPDVAPTLDPFLIARRLTAVDSYHSLTQVLLDLLNRWDFIASAAVYEVHGGVAHSARSGSETRDIVVSRFPDPATREIPPALLARFKSCLRHRHTLRGPAADGGGEHLLFPVADTIGPPRVVELELNAGYTIPPGLLENLVAIYHNQVRLLDGKERDLLTGLLNRQTFDALLGTVTDYCRSQQRDGSSQGAWFAVMDIDHFKRVNDRYGHLYGDEVLLLFARLMEGCFRYTDFLFRFGGEEFVALLTYAEETGARRALERFRAKVREYAFPRVGHISVSIGYCPIEVDSMGPSLIDMADRALYYAKRHGRNRVVAFDETGELPPVVESMDVEYF